MERKLRSLGRFRRGRQRAINGVPALSLKPDPAITRQARINALFCLSQAKDPDGFFNCFARVTAVAPKLAFDLLDRSELAPMRADPRWDAAAANARDGAQGLERVQQAWMLSIV